MPISPLDDREIITGVFYFSDSPDAVARVYRAVAPIAIESGLLDRCQLTFWYADKALRASDGWTRTAKADSWERVLNTAERAQLSTVSFPNKGIEDAFVDPIRRTRGYPIGEGPCSLSVQRHVYPGSPATAVLTIDPVHAHKRNIDVRKLVNDFTSVLGDGHGCFYGFIDTCTAAECASTLLYSFSTIATVRRQLEENLYRSEGPNRANYVRNVYWGNYLGPGLAKRFDPTGELAAQFAAGTDPDWDPSTEEPGIPGYTQYVQKTADGGLFLAMSESPMTWAEVGGGNLGFGESADLALWVHRQFRDKGMLL